ncbi:basic proline-rich protein-like [Cuculus canorus]|uniref:basic proline-rich protein-like n=1 Tax=Cuculus canorus TaxID=55661 RepID=UPI0023AAC7AF|nr:basic proline-rich protein-like [Cuculus canorus]
MQLDLHSPREPRRDATGSPLPQGAPQGCSWAPHSPREPRRDAPGIPVHPGMQPDPHSPKEPRGDAAGPLPTRGCSRTPPNPGMQPEAPLPQGCSRSPSPPGAPLTCPQPPVPAAAPPARQRRPRPTRSAARHGAGPAGSPPRTPAPKDGRDGLPPV